MEPQQIPVQNCQIKSSDTKPTNSIVINSLWFIFEMLTVKWLINKKYGEIKRFDMTFEMIHISCSILSLGFISVSSSSPLHRTSVFWLSLPSWNYWKNWKISFNSISWDQERVCCCSLFIRFFLNSFNLIATMSVKSRLKIHWFHANTWRRMSSEYIRVRIVVCNTCKFA